ncbi:PglZ domain-containing protein [Peribacillus frigoritolerans]|uniref:PglZ domain-containing protein n=1 Tax=Peribacillus frigoritolerans TaxID=450367 RepID=A0AAJ1VBM1_9BACI|nr:PglZ domain-containing protein [Peribacillus frigoritolerans]MDM5283770.1 PglZ domain-containing protein [Peribacillus frigoritolerans]
MKAPAVLLWVLLYNMKKSFYDMVAADLNRHFQKRSVVIWLDKYQSFTSEYERYVKEEKIDRFVFGGSLLQLRHQIVQLSPNFEGRILIYIPGSNHDLTLLKEYHWLAEVFNDSIRDLLSKHYNINLPLNENDRLQKQLLFIKTKWDILSDDLIENLNEEKLEQFILHDDLSMDELDKKETILRFITDKTYYDTLKELENIHAFCQLANDFYGFLFNEQQSYEEMVEIIANTLIRTELSLETNDAKYIENPKIAYRRSELFHLWSKHDFYRSHFEEWSKQLSEQYRQQIALKETEELYSIKGFSIIDEELWNRIEKQFHPNEININLLRSPSIDQFILIAEARMTRATDKEIIQKWDALAQLLHFIVELNKFKDYINQTSMFQDPESIVNEYIQQKWWSIDYRFRKAEEQYKENNSLILSLIKYANGQYIHHFLKPLNAQFQRCLEMKQDFSINGIIQQRHFWREHMTGSSKKTAVIYVDALRYEMGAELQHLIDEEWHVEVDSLLSSIPSITKVGMTSLLPLSKSILEWKKEKEDFVIYTENIQMNNKTDRIKFLENVLDASGKVINLENLYRLSKQQVRAEITDKEKIIVYSNEIDTTGENIEDSAVYLFPQLLKKIKIVTENLLKAGIEEVIITADHGFLLTNGLEGWNQIPLSNEVEVVKKSRRYAIADNKIKGDWIVKELAWSHHKGDFYQYYPSSNYFFSASGGAKFSHGGLSIQEVIIPVLTVSPMNTSKVYIDDPRLERKQSSLEEVNKVDETVNIQDQIKIHLEKLKDDLSKRENFLLSCFMDSTKWNENELIQRAATKGIKFKAVLVSEAMSDLIDSLEAQGKDWFKTEMINGSIYEYSIK